MEIWVVIRIEISLEIWRFEWGSRQVIMEIWVVIRIEISIETWRFEWGLGQAIYGDLGCDSD